MNTKEEITNIPNISMETACNIADRIDMGEKIYSTPIDDAIKYLYNRPNTAIKLVFAIKMAELYKYNNTDIEVLTLNRKLEITEILLGIHYTKDYAYSNELIISKIIHNLSNRKGLLHREEASYLNYLYKIIKVCYKTTSTDKVSWKQNQDGYWVIYKPQTPWT